MELVAQERGTISRMYGCDCCSRWMLAGDTMYLLVFKGPSEIDDRIDYGNQDISFGKYHFDLVCEDCVEVMA